MAKAYKCDRCERYEDDDPIAGVTFNMPKAVDEPKRTQAMELCSQCLANLRDFLDFHKRDMSEGV